MLHPSIARTINIWNYHITKFGGGGYSSFRTAKVEKTSKEKKTPASAKDPPATATGPLLHSSASQGKGDRIGEPPGTEKSTG